MLAISFWFALTIACVQARASALTLSWPRGDTMQAHAKFSCRTTGIYFSHFFQKHSFEFSSIIISQHG